MFNYLTKENITFILAAVSSVGTIAGWFYTFISSRKNIDLQLLTFHHGDKGILAYAMFINNSGLPISILEISVKIDGILYPATKIPKEAVNSVRRVGKEIVNSHTDYTIAFPIMMTGSASTSGYLYFPLPKGTPELSSNTVSFQVCTNRGKAIEKKLSLNVPQR